MLHLHFPIIPNLARVEDINRASGYCVAHGLAYWIGYGWAYQRDYEVDTWRGYGWASQRTRPTTRCRSNLTRTRIPPGEVHQYRRFPPRRHRRSHSRGRRSRRSLSRPQQAQGGLEGSPGSFAVAALGLATAGQHGAVEGVDDLTEVVVAQTLAERLSVLLDDLSGCVVLTDPKRISEPAVGDRVRVLDVRLPIIGAPNVDVPVVDPFTVD